MGQHPQVVGWDTERSAELIQTLKQEATRPEYQVRFTWSPGAIAMWDNRAVHHYAVRPESASSGETWPADDDRCPSDLG
jgi:alpha-ketoglutarate-dependent taurine dioxygenase